MKSPANQTSKLALAAALAVVSLPALAVEWRRVATTDSEKVLIDLDSVHAFEGDVRARVMHSYDQTETLGDMYAHRSKVVLYSVQCGKRELGYMQWSMQTHQFGAGRTVWADGVTQVTYYRAGSDSVDNAIVNSVCSAYTQRNPSQQSLS